MEPNTEQELTEAIDQWSTRAREQTQIISDLTNQHENDVAEADELRRTIETLQAERDGAKASDRKAHEELRAVRRDLDKRDEELADAVQRIEDLEAAPDDVRLRQWCAVKAHGVLVSRGLMGNRTAPNSYDLLSVARYIENGAHPGDDIPEDPEDDLGDDALQVANGLGMSIGLSGSLGSAVADQIARKDQRGDRL